MVHVITFKNNLNLEYVIHPLSGPKGPKDQTWCQNQVELNMGVECCYHGYLEDWTGRLGAMEGQQVPPWPKPIGFWDLQMDVVLDLGTRFTSTPSWGGGS